MYAGEAMIKYMNLSTDPCDDFYEYACGNWNKYNKMPADRSTYDTFEILRESLDSILRDLLTHQNVNNVDVHRWPPDIKLF